VSSTNIQVISRMVWDKGYC